MDGKRISIWILIEASFINFDIQEWKLRSDRSKTQSINIPRCSRIEIWNVSVSAVSVQFRTFDLSRLKNERKTSNFNRSHRHASNWILAADECYNVSVGNCRLEHVIYFQLWCCFLCLIKILSFIDTIVHWTSLSKRIRSVKLVKKRMFRFIDFGRSILKWPIKNFY